MTRFVAIAATLWLSTLASVFAATGTVDDIVNAYSNRELINGFKRTVFGAEDPSQRHREGGKRVKKFTGQVRVHVINLAQQDRRADIRRFVDQLNTTVRGLSISMTNSESRAGMIVFLVDRADYKNVINETMPANFDKRFLLNSDCSAVTGGQRGNRLDRAFVYIVVNEGNHNFRHCMIEEITQSLGPVNDDWRLTDSIYNDYSKVSAFNVFDWFILSMLYDRRVSVGMTAQQAEQVLPVVIADARVRLKKLISKRMVGIPR